MPHGSITETLPAPSDAVFPLLHDYSRRLQWDTLLKTPASPTTSPTPSPTSLCTGRWYLGSLALKTRYIAFSPPSLAAVKLLNRPLFFHTFAASIRLSPPKTLSGAATSAPLHSAATSEPRPSGSDRCAFAANLVASSRARL